MNDEYSVIFMRDGGNTRRLRLDSTLGHVLLIILVVVSLVAVASLALNWKLYRHYLALQRENAALRGEVESHAPTTSRLANLERFLRKADPATLDKLVPAAAPPFPAMTAAAESGGSDDSSVPELLPQAGPERQNAETIPADALTAPLTPPADAPAAQLPASTAPPDGAEQTKKAAGAMEPVEPAAPAPLPAADDSPVAVDKGFVRVETLSARRAGARSLRISFNLYNTGRLPQVSGRAAFELLLAGGETFPLDHQGDTSYRIKRLKKILGNPALPPGVSDTEGAFVRVIIYADDEIVYQTVTPLQ